MKLKGKVALVTGSGRNIGRCTVLSLASMGADVVVNSRTNFSEAEAVAAEARVLGVRALAITADHAQVDQVNAMFQRAVAELGPIDILVNNAAVRGVRPFADLSQGEWDQVIEGKLTGTYLCTRAVVPDMMARRSGRIINVLGSLAQRGAPNRVHVAASVNGVMGLTKALALELAPYGITVNGVSPGLIDTEREDDGPALAYRRENAATIPMGRLGRIDEVASLIAYLATADASYITGQIIAVNGGIYLNNA